MKGSTMTLTPVFLEIQNEIAIITIDNPPVNALSHAVRSGIVSCLVQAEQNDEVKAIIIACQGRTFIAGADITEFGKTPQEPSLPAVLTKINHCKKPVIAALFGTVLGGGFELALSCHYRVALSGTKVGLPEVTLGLIPGAGGTQLLPRIAGIALALEMISLGKMKKVEQLTEYNLIDLLITDVNNQDKSNINSNLLEQPLVFTKQLLKSNQTTKLIEQKPIESTPPLTELCQQWRDKLAKKARGQQAPQRAINSIENALLLPLDEAMKKEREFFIQCRDSTQSSAMRHAFFAEKSAAKLTYKAKPLTINSVAIIGAGTMGGGIAMCFASAGFNVVLVEMNQDNIDRGISAITTRYQQAQSRGIITAQQANDYLALISGTCDYADLSDVDLVVEAAFETMAVKKEIFSKLDNHCKPEAILATNTSYLDINQIANITKRPEKVLGMHFFSPANIMKLLEVVQADKTNEETLVTAMALGKKINKISVAVNVCYGFVGNRMYACYGREANMLLLEGATPTQIDNAMTSWGMAMGPLAVNDMSGIDIAYKARQENPNLSKDPTYFAAANTLVEANRLGQKTSAGFYHYDQKTKKPSHDEKACQLIANKAKALGVKQRLDISDEEIQNRLIFALINEGANILHEGIATKASDIDVIWLNGYGFPRYIGGPMHYAETIGIEKVVTVIEHFNETLKSDYWKVSPYLLKQLEDALVNNN